VNERQQWSTRVSELRLSLKSNWNADLARRDNQCSAATFPHEEGRSQAAKPDIFTELSRLPYVQMKDDEKAVEKITVITSNHDLIRKDQKRGKRKELL